MFDGIKVHEPTYLYLKAAHHDPNVSWFETPEQQGGGAPGEALAEERRTSARPLASIGLRGQTQAGAGLGRREAQG
jgi:hypothetical protein